jgi:hypothetical protein
MKFLEPLYDRKHFESFQRSLSTKRFWQLLVRWSIICVIIYGSIFVGLLGMKLYACLMIPIILFMVLDAVNKDRMPELKKAVQCFCASIITPVIGIILVAIGTHSVDLFKIVREIDFVLLPLYLVCVVCVMIIENNHDIELEWNKYKFRHNPSELTIFTTEMQKERIFAYWFVINHVSIGFFSLLLANYISVLWIFTLAFFCVIAGFWKKSEGFRQKMIDRLKTFVYAKDVS